jgi:hypothetical protein
MEMTDEDDEVVPSNTEEDRVKYPDITVKLVGNDGNAFMVLGLTKKALQQGGAPKEEIDAFWKEATAGDYNHLLQTCMAWVHVT